ncbi:uncharacterized protein LOC144349045 [Saccoglossus kowalevskii]
MKSSGFGIFMWLLNWKKVGICTLVTASCIALYVLNTAGSFLYLKVNISEGPLGFLLPETAFEGTLEPHDYYVVPNVAHLIWFSCHQFNFIHLLSIVSIYKVMKPDRIVFYTDCEPMGQWWDEARLVPVLEVVQRDPPTEIFGRKLNRNIREHWADVARLDILSSVGGVYFDTDIFVVAPLDSLRKYDYVVGRPSRYTLNNGVILTSSNSTFLKLFLDSYREYNSFCYSCNSVFNQNKLAWKHRHLVHIENESMMKPNSNHWRTLFFGKFPWPAHHFTFHVWIRNFQAAYPDVVFTPDYIKQLNTSFGEICRYIYYGDRTMTSDDSNRIPWWTNLKVDDNR